MKTKINIPRKAVKRKKKKSRRRNKDALWLAELNF